MVSIHDKSCCKGTAFDPVTKVFHGCCIHPHQSLVFSYCLALVKRRSCNFREFSYSGNNNPNLQSKVTYIEHIKPNHIPGRRICSKNRVLLSKPLHYIAILVTVGLFGVLNVQVIGTMLVTLSILFLTWKISEELALHLDTNGDESLFFIKVLVWVASLAFFSPYWTPWFSPQLLYTMLVLAAFYNIFRFYRLRSYPDAALAFIWLIFSIVVSTEAVQVGIAVWLVWLVQFILLSRKSKVLKRSVFIISISAVVIGGYWVYLVSNFDFRVDLTQSSGLQLIQDPMQVSSLKTTEILQMVEATDEVAKVNQISYIRLPLLVMLGLGSVYIFYKRKSAGFFMTSAIIGTCIHINDFGAAGLGGIPYLAPYVVFLTVVVSLRIFRRVPEIHRFALSGFFLSMIFLFIFPSMDISETKSTPELIQISEILQETDENRQVIFSEYAIPNITTIYDPRFEHILDTSNQVQVWDTIYQANYWAVIKGENGETHPLLQEGPYFEKVSETENWILYQRNINYLR
jgi:hypothetical protein